MDLSSPWFWLIVGLIMLGAELVTGAFVMVFFGLAGLATAALAAVGEDRAWVLVSFYAFSSLTTMLIFRKHLLRHRGGKVRQPDEGNSLILTARLPAKGEGVIQYQGSPWTAINLENEDLEVGSWVKIDRTEGIRLFVRKEK